MSKLADKKPVRRRPARRGDGDRLRGEILQATRAMLVASGGDTSQVTLRGVAREVGVTATSIYLHFPRIDELIYEMKQLLLGELTETVRVATGKAGSDPRRRLLALARAYVDFGFREPGLYHVVFTSISIKVDKTDTTNMHGRLSELGSELIALVQEDVAAVVGNRHATMVFVHLWTAMHGMVTLRIARPRFSWPDLDAEVKDLVDRLLPAVTKKSTT